MITILNAASVVKLLTIGVLISMLQIVCWQRPITLTSGVFAAWLASLIGYLGIMLTEHGSIIHYLLAPLAHSVAVFFYLATRLLFADHNRLSAWDLAILAVALAWALIDAIVHQPGTNTELSIQLFSLFKLALVLSALVRLIMDRKQDLIEVRRRASLAIVLISGVYSSVVIIVETLWTQADRLPLDGVNSVLIAGLVLWVNSTLLTPSHYLNDWLTVSPSANDTPKAEPISHKNSRDLLIVRLNQQLEQGIYRESGLSIADLASALRVPEYKCRQFINQRLGYRNFNDFLNHYRIKEAAKRLQQEPEQAITHLALSMGYRSLSTFNKAFKAMMGCTPSQYKAESQTEN